MSLKFQLIALFVLIAVLSTIGLFSHRLQYPIVAFTVMLSIAASGLVARRFLGELSRVESSLSTIPLRVTQLTAAEQHSMATILRRFPACTLPTTTWSMRFTNLHTILNLMDSNQPRQIVEFGSGLSTLMIGAWLRERGIGHLVSFDHDAGWAELTRSALAHEGLSEWVDVVVVPLSPTQSHGRDLTWYDLSKSSVPLENVEFIVVDGPPAGSPPKSLNRLAVLERMENYLAEKCCIVLDDAFRPGEKEVVSLWLNRWPEFTHVMRGQTTGLAVLSRRMERSSVAEVKPSAVSVHRDDSASLEKIVP